MTANGLLQRNMSFQVMEINLLNLDLNKNSSNTVSMQ
jgi:hypothetical protein